MTFARRLINVQFTLGVDPNSKKQRTFTESGTDTALISGLRVSAKIEKAGGTSMGHAELEIYGLPLSLMNDLSTLGINPIIVGPNFVSVTAGTDTNAMSEVFQGTITNGWTDLNASPSVCFRVDAHTGLFQATASLAASSFRGSADVSDILQGLATQLGVPFEDGGVRGMVLSNPYFEGSPRNQILSCIKAAGIEWNGLDDRVLAVWPRGGSRSGTATLVSPSNGLVNYPCFTSKGVMLQTLFNPALRYGSKILIDGSITPANGIWSVYKLDHDLDAQVPNGRWFSTIAASKPWLTIIK